MHLLFEFELSYLNDIAHDLFLFFPYKFVIDRFAAVNQNILSGTEGVGDGEEICPFSNFLRGSPFF